MRTRLHDNAVCGACEAGDHEDCVEEIEGVLCGCVDAFHFADADEEDAEW